jgi:hypothetical protein
MPEKIFQDYQGVSIKIDGVCYNFDGETTAPVNATPSEIGGVYDSCLECVLESSSSSEGNSSSSESFLNTSSSSSSEGYSSSSSSSSGGYSSSSSSSSEGYSSSSSSSSEGYSSSSSSSSEGYSESSSSEGYSSSSSSSSSEGYSESSSSSSFGNSESSSSESAVALAQCNCPDATGPKMNVTVSWTGTPKAVTDNGFGKLDFLGCSGTDGWNNGDTREVCPTVYTCTTGSSVTEEWNANFTASFSGRIRMQNSDNAGTTLRNELTVDIRHTYSYPVPQEHFHIYAQYMGSWFGGTPYSYGIASKGVTPSDIHTTDGLLGDNLFSTVTTSDGITVSWARGAGTWGC